MAEKEKKEKKVSEQPETQPESCLLYTSRCV